MKLVIKAIRDFQEFVAKMESYNTNPEVFERPIPNYIETVVNLRDEDIKDYLIKPIEVSDIGVKEIEITVEASKRKVEILKSSWTQEIEDELDNILEVRNKRFRNGK
jgi:hypothetical protein